MWIPRPPEEVFDFFADVGNLRQLTPRWAHLQILTRLPVNMRRGALIDYRLRIHGFPVQWQSEITEWDPPHGFVDRQVVGPCRKWVHEHTFRAERGGTQVEDDVRYRLPGGHWAHRLFVRHDVEKMFAYRRTKLLALFGEDGDPSA